MRRVLRSVPGIGPPDQSMWSDDELRDFVQLEAAYFGELGVRIAVTGWTLTALLSTRLAGIPLVTEHAGSFLPPVFERGLLPEPSRPVGMPLERWLPTPIRRRLFNAERPDSRSTPGASTESPPSSASRAFRASSRCCSAT